MDAYHHVILPKTCRSSDASSLTALVGSMVEPGTMGHVQEDSHSKMTTADAFTIIAVTFVAMLLISNIAATKLFGITVGPAHFIFDGGALLFPFTYVLGDVLAEVYGFAKARMVILMGFAASVLAAGVFLIVQAMPPAEEYANQEAFEAVLGFVPRIVAASLLAFLVGQLLNAYVLVKIKERYGPDRLWVRLLGSSVVGEAADTIVFCTVAFLGVLTGANFWNYVLVGFVYKMTFEVILIPVSYFVIARVRRLDERAQVA